MLFSVSLFLLVWVWEREGDEQDLREILKNTKVQTVCVEFQAGKEGGKEVFFSLEGLCSSW